MTAAGRIVEIIILLLLVVMFGVLLAYAWPMGMGVTVLVFIVFSGVAGVIGWVLYG